MCEPSMRPFYFPRYLTLCAKYYVIRLAEVHTPPSKNTISRLSVSNINRCDSLTQYILFFSTERRKRKILLRSTLRSDFIAIKQCAGCFTISLALRSKYVGSAVCYLCPLPPP